MRRANGIGEPCYVCWMGFNSFLFVCFPIIGIVSFACSAEPACDCPTPGVTILATQGDVVTIAANGTACSDGALICVSSSDRAAVVDCQRWIVNPPRAGTCHIDVSLRDGSTRSADFEIVDRRMSSCCSGLYMTGDGTFVVPRSEAGVSFDAGRD